MVLSRSLGHEQTSRASSKPRFDFRLDDQDWDKVCWGLVPKGDARTHSHQLSRRAKWAAVLRRAARPEGGGWREDFAAEEMTPGRLQALARAIDQEFFQGTFHRALFRRMQRPVRYEAASLRTATGASLQPPADAVASRTTPSNLLARRRSGLPPPLVLVRPPPRWSAHLAGSGSETDEASNTRPGGALEDRVAGQAMAAEGAAGDIGSGGRHLVAEPPGHRAVGIGPLGGTRPALAGYRTWQRPERYGAGGAATADEAARARAAPSGTSKAACNDADGGRDRSGGGGRGRWGWLRLWPWRRGIDGGAGGDARAGGLGDGAVSWAFGGPSATYTHNKGQVTFWREVWGSVSPSPERPVRIDGVPCTSRLSWLAHTLGHEMLHVMLLNMCGDFAKGAPVNMSLAGHGYNFMILNWYLLGHRGHQYEATKWGLPRQVPWRL